MVQRTEKNVGAHPGRLHIMIDDELNDPAGPNNGEELDTPKITLDQPMIPPKTICS